MPGQIISRGEPTTRYSPLTRLSGQRPLNFVDAISCLSEHEVLDLLALAIGEPTGEKLAQIMVAYSSDPAYRLFAFLDRDRVVAVIGAHIGAAGSATILHLAVRSGYRRRGLGRRLIESLRDHLGLWELLAETDREAVAFYERCGFEARSLGERYPGVERFLCRWGAGGGR